MWRLPFKAIAQGQKSFEFSHVSKLSLKSDLGDSFMITRFTFVSFRGDPYVFKPCAPMLGRHAKCWLTLDPLNPFIWMNQEFCLQISGIETIVQPVYATSSVCLAWLFPILVYCHHTQIYDKEKLLYVERCTMSALTDMFCKIVSRLATYWSKENTLVHWTSRLFIWLAPNPIFQRSK